MESPATTEMSKPRVSVSIADRWARECAARAIRRSGGTPIRLTSIADVPTVSDVCVGTVCDLAPWSNEVIDQFRAIRRSDPLNPFVLYLPLENADIATALRAEDPALRYCVQDHTPDSLAGLEHALHWLFESGASSSLIAMILDGRPPANAMSVQFLQWAVRAIGTRCGHPVADGARALGVSSRTLGRRLNNAHLPPPVEMYSWVKLLAVAWRADRSQSTLGRSAKIFHLDAVRLYQLKQRLLARERIKAIRSAPLAMPIVLDAFNERCHGLERTHPEW